MPKSRTSEDVQKQWKHKSHQTCHGCEVNPLKSTLGKALIPELWTDAVTTSTSFRTNNSRPRVSCSASNQHHLKDLKYRGAPRDGAAGWLEGLINVTRRTPCNREDKRQK